MGKSWGGGGGGENIGTLGSVAQEITSDSVKKNNSANKFMVSFVK